MSTYAIAIGDKNPEKPEDVLRRRARNSLASVRPSKLVTDYSSGWSLIVLDEARKLGIPYIGVMPYEPSGEEYKVKARTASSNLVFFNSVDDYLKNPFVYFDWLEKNIDEVLLFLNPDTQGIERAILRVLRKKSIRNLFI